MRSGTMRSGVRGSDAMKSDMGSKKKTGSVKKRNAGKDRGYGKI